MCASSTCSNAMRVPQGDHQKLYIGPSPLGDEVGKPIHFSGATRARSDLHSLPGRFSMAADRDDVNLFVLNECDPSTVGEICVNGATLGASRGLVEDLAERGSGPLQVLDGRSPCIGMRTYGGWPPSGLAFRDTCTTYPRGHLPHALSPQLFLRRQVCLGVQSRRADKL